MPLQSQTVTTSFTAYTVTVNLSLSPYKGYVPGEKTTLTVTVLKDNAAWQGVQVYAYMRPKGQSTLQAQIMGPQTTGSDGKASYTITWPWAIDFGSGSYSLPCKSFEVWAGAFDGVSNQIGISSFIYVEIGYPTRLSIQVPSTVVVGQRFDINGKLEYQTSEGGNWVGLSSKSVDLTLDNTSLGTVTTDANGNFTKSGVTVSTSGTHGVRATYYGTFTYGLTSINTRTYAVTGDNVGRAVVIGLPIATGIALMYVMKRRG